MRLPLIMKRLFSVLILVLVPSLAFADPYLVSDPYGPCGQSGQTACPLSANINEDGISIAADVALQPDLSIRHDLVTMPIGEHEYTATYNFSAGRVSVLSDPFLWLRTGNPPVNLNAVGSQ